MDNNTDSKETEDLSPNLEVSSTSPKKSHWYSIFLDHTILYDFAMLSLIVFDLSLILIDNIMMSSSLLSFNKWLVSDYNLLFIDNLLSIYHNSKHIYFSHDTYSIIGGIITIALIVEISVRWIWAIINKTHYRWFFFPFVHWYEVIGCFPQLRVLRLLRAVAIGRRLYKKGHRFLPEKWLDTGKFYYAVLLEEISDRVLLTAITNIRSQLSNSLDNQILVKKTIDNNRENIESMVLSMLRTELAPRLRQELLPDNKHSPVAKHVGIAVSEAIMKTPEISFILRKIPIAGSIIESQLMGISEKVGYNIADSVNKRLLDNEVLDEVFVSIAHGIAQIDTSNPAVEALVADIVEESLTAFEQQIKIQQWQHHEKIDRIHL